ncbi:MAG: hypothetical protein PF569_07910 [Candidatus Woesearchaeota archaeon]|jgi:tRNA (guanine26-N2/guanine27-N2)-dimethyltransferase|nr:hypothetical protein [Candidatus Woesearchaeota archaeon]
MLVQNKNNFSKEENVIIKSYGSKISKELTVFFNPEMKLNRDISLLVIDSYFNKPIKFCDPMAASGIREIRFMKTIPDKFSKLVLGDISKTAIKNIKRNFKDNKVSLKKVELKHQNALMTILEDYYDFIEIDPFGSPVPFLDLACQKTKHKGILSVTATDTAALCGTYPKTTMRRYNTKVEKTYYLEEVGLRNLIAHCQIQAAKYDKNLIPLVSYSYKHYYKIFFKVEESRERSLESIKNLKWLEWDRETQETKVLDLETKKSFGKTYVGKLHDKDFLDQLIASSDLIEDNAEILKFLDKMKNEIEMVGYYNPHKFQKAYKFESQLSFNEMIERLQEKNFEVSRPHNNGLGIKTNANYKEFLKIMKSKK